MNDTATSSGTLLSGATGTFTAIHLVFVALFAVAAVAIIVVGMRRRRGQREAERAFEARVEEARDEAPAPPPPPSAPAPQDAAPGPDPVADEPIPAVVATPATPAPAVEAASAPAAADDPADGPVTQLKGLGPKVAARLAELGVTRVGDLAALDEAGAARLDAQLGAFTGRMARDRWVEQARLLAAGDRAGFEAAFGRL